LPVRGLEGYGLSVQELLVCYRRDYTRNVMLLY
jgi:hypothetical protein